MSCFINAKTPFENIKSTLLAGGANEKDAEYDATVAMDFLRRSRDCGEAENTEKHRTEGRK